MLCLHLNESQMVRQISGIIQVLWIRHSCFDSGLHQLFRVLRLLKCEWLLSWNCHTLFYFTRVFADSLSLEVTKFNNVLIKSSFCLILEDIIHASTRIRSALDHVITNHPSTFTFKTSGSCVRDINLELFIPKIYSHSAYISFTQPKYITFHRRDFFPEMLFQLGNHSRLLFNLGLIMWNF